MTTEAPACPFVSEAHVCIESPTRQTTKLPSSRISAAYSRVGSLRRRPANWMLYGTSSFENPDGRQIDGVPVRFIGIVKSAARGVAADHAVWNSAGPLICISRVIGHAGEPPADLSAYAALVLPMVKRLGLALIVEPGRFLVAESGVLLTRVLYRKRSGGRELLVTDAGMADLLRPSHYDAYHRIVAVHEASQLGTFDVVGPICESGDFLALAREMDDVEAGALLCVCTTGAYGYSMASNYNARPRAAEVMIDGDRWAVVTARETYEDLIRRETSPPQWRTT